MNLILLLTDHLNLNISSLDGVDKDHDVILMLELNDEFTRVKHHKKKLVLQISAMRHFTEELKAHNYQVDYIKLTDNDNTQNLPSELKRAIKRHNPQKIICTEPSEYHTQQQLKDFDIEIRKNKQFFCSKQEFKEWAEGQKQLRMEFFYRQMRKKHNILMDEDASPIGGKWNYDHDNRKPPTKKLKIPKPYIAKTDEITKEVIQLVESRYADHFGDIKPFHFAVTREQALRALDSFIEVRLKYFGDYQDAMLEGEPWMYHSHISFYINLGLLEPLECIHAAERAYFDNRANLNEVEGFIRQILGWREYVRGIYWLKMPNYKKLNKLNAQNKLPDFYWTGETKLNCLKQVINETKQNAYAHHIQRLMVAGNFALIAGFHPDEVNEWYWIVYADAYEWVELPNVTGMVLYADGGVMASKPYASSGAYINKMSDYCQNCHYKVTKKNGEQACPFNYLYWDFLIRNKDKLANNQRMKMIYSVLFKMSEEKIQAIKDDSQRFLAEINN